MKGMKNWSFPPVHSPEKPSSLRGKGVPFLRTSGRGDQLVMVNVEIPNHLTDKQRELFTSLAETLGSECASTGNADFLNDLKEVLGG